jgi:hypothetical protein
VYASALAIWGEGNGLKENLTGVVLLVMSTFALLPLLKLFTFVADSTDARGRGGAATAAGVAATGANVAGAVRSSGSQATADVAQTFGPAAAAAPSGAAMATPLAPAVAAVKVAQGATKHMSNASKPPEENQ